MSWILAFADNSIFIVECGTAGITQITAQFTHKILTKEQRGLIPSRANMITSENDVFFQ